MNWIFGKNQNHQFVQSTPLQQQRLKQIKSLNICNSNVVEESRDFEYTVPFSCGKISCKLHVSLPPHFPNEKPLVSVSPPMQHPWVDGEMNVVGSSELNTFHMHSDLGKVIHHIVKEFKKNPPQFVEANDFEQSPYQQQPASTSSSTLGNLVNTSDDCTNVIYSDRPPCYTTACHINSPKTETDRIVSQLETLSEKELGDICVNPDLLLEYVNEMDCVVDLQNQRIKLVEENEEIAKLNMSLEPVIEDLKVDLKETFERYNELYNSFEEKVCAQDELHKNFDINNISTNLRICIMQAEEESDDIAENFLQGSVKLDEFISSFLGKRKTFHLRRMKEDRLKNVLLYK